MRGAPLFLLIACCLCTTHAEALVTRDILISLPDTLGRYHYRETLHSEGERISYPLPASIDANSVIFSTGEKGRWQATRTRHPVFSGEHGGVLFSGQWDKSLADKGEGRFTLELPLEPLGRQNNLLTLSWVLPEGMRIERFSVSDGRGSWQQTGTLLQYIGEFNSQLAFSIAFARQKVASLAPLESAKPDNESNRLSTSSSTLPAPELAAARTERISSPVPPTETNACQRKQIHAALSDFFCGEETEVVLEEIEFERNSPALVPEARRALDRVVLAMNELPDMRVEIAGYTDSRGSETLNRRLSAKRAGTARLYLIYRDIAPERIVSTGYGEIKPIADNSTPEGRRKNRRLTLRKLPADQ